MSTTEGVSYARSGIYDGAYLRIELTPAAVARIAQRMRRSGA